MQFQMKSVLALVAAFAAVFVCVVAEREPDLRVYKSFYRGDGGASSADEQARDFELPLIRLAIRFHSVHASDQITMIFNNRSTKRNSESRAHTRRQRMSGEDPSQLGPQLAARALFSGCPRGHHPELLLRALLGRRLEPGQVDPGSSPAAEPKL